MKPHSRAALLITKKQVGPHEWIVALEGDIPFRRDEAVHFTLFRGSESHVDSIAQSAIDLIAGTISQAVAETWIESGVCSVCKKLQSEHPPGPPCVPKLKV